MTSLTAGRRTKLPTVSEEQEDEGMRKCVVIGLMERRLQAAKRDIVRPIEAPSG